MHRAGLQVAVHASAGIWAGCLRVLADAYGLTKRQRLSLMDCGVLNTDRSWLLMKVLPGTWRAGGGGGGTPASATCSAGVRCS